jgi:hypothetical protein
VFVISRDYRQISEKFSHIDRTDPVQLQTARLELEDLSQNTEGHAIFGESVRCYRSDGTVRPTSAAEMATAIEPDDIVLYSRVDPNANPLEQHIESIDFFSKRARSHHVSEKATEMAQRAFAVGKHFDDKRSSAAASKDK